MYQKKMYEKHKWSYYFQLFVYGKTSEMIIFYIAINEPQWYTNTRSAQEMRKKLVEKNLKFRNKSKSYNIALI